MKNSDKKSVANILRKKATEIINNRQSNIDPENLESNTQKLIQELEVHQVELEMQNDELFIAKQTAQEAVEKYIELYDNAPSGYYTLSENGEINELNLRGAEMLEKDRDSLINSSFGFFTSIDTRPTFNLFLDKVFSSEKKESCEVVIQLDDNKFLNVLLTGIVTQNKDKCLVTMVDISSLKFIEKELVLAKEKAEESNRLKSAFLANMSHEIRTPMNSIIGFSSLLKNPNLTDKEKEKYIDLIEKGGTRMLNIINDIINISKIESGQQETTLTALDVNEHVKFIYDFFLPETKKKGIDFQYENTLLKNKATIISDCDKLNIILTNLVKNAIKFTDYGSIKIGYVKKDNYLEFYVHDTGQGIKEEQKDIIFERFRQGSVLLTRNYDGSGLGLTISKAYVEMLGGKIWFESKFGIGSSFYFTIPYKTKKKKELTNNEADKCTQSYEYVNNLKILIAEDDKPSEILVEMVVKAFSKEVLIARTGIEAINIFKNNPDIDLILMDIKLPELDGYEVTKQIRKLDKNVIIIAQTAFGILGDREKALEAGCDEHISKPIYPDLLVEIINLTFEKHSQNNKVSQVH